MKITVETVVNGKLNNVWDAWNSPEDIKLWNSAHEDWHTTRSTVDLREGGKFQSRMEAKDGPSFSARAESRHVCHSPAVTLRRYGCLRNTNQQARGDN
jgi:uncharacterized protein YndB with AHSA1/START domain